MEAWSEIVIDDRKKEDIIDEIERLSKSYTPEWKLLRKDPDAGSVIGIIFAEQIADNIRNMNLMLEKYHAEFANMYGISLKAANPASTVVVLQAADTISGGTPFYKGTQMIGENENGDEVIFEAKHDLYVTSAKLTEVFLASGREPQIFPFKGNFFCQNLLTGQLETVDFYDEASGEIVLFDYRGNGIGEQALILGHRFLFEQQNGKICLKFHGSSARIAERIADDKQYQFYYLTEQGLTLFDKVKQREEFVELIRYGQEKKVTYGETDYSLIIIKPTKVCSEPLMLSEIEIIAEDVTEQPDFIYDGSKELENSHFLPFGQKPVLYQECYIGKAPWMEQAGILITMEFHLSFETFQESGRQVADKNLKIIKRRPKTTGTVVQHECFVQEVALEYFNGNGWKKLQCSTEVEAIFASPENEGTYKISFEVPEDWETTTQGGYEQQCFRLQVKRADNCYMSGVVYHYPVLSDFSLTLSCKDHRMYPEIMEGVSGIRRENFAEKLQKREMTEIFTKVSYGGDYLFLGFDQQFENGPICLYFDMKERLNLAGIQMEYSYSSSSGFQKLKVMDGTQNFEHSGSVIFMPPADQAKLKMEGVERYWIRIEDKGAGFATGKFPNPVIKQICTNAVEVQNIETGEEEEYFIDVVSADMTFPLYANNILSAEVWVNEKEQLSVAEMEQMMQKMPKKVQVEYNFLGEIEDFFVKWEEIDNFDEAKEQARVYIIERGMGQLVFGDGVHVRIPQNTRSVAFKVRLTCCSGKAGNIKAGGVNGFRGNLLSVKSVSNPVPALGGSNPESLKEALLRGSTLLSSRKRLISEMDYIREAGMFSKEIDQVACVTGQSKYKKTGDSTISLVLLLSDYEKGSFVFRNIENALKEHLLRHCEMVCGPENLEITEPIFVRISVHIWLGVRNVTNSMEMKELWKERIEDYLEPVRNSVHGGWKIGTLPRESQIRMMLNSLDTDSALQKFSIQAVYQDHTGIHETALDSIKINPFMVCCNGEHRIIFSKLL